MRTSVLGIVNFDDLEKVKENTRQISRVTHIDTRCVASCVAVTVAIALMLQGETEDVMEKVPFFSFLPPIAHINGRFLLKILYARHCWKH